MAGETHGGGTQLISELPKLTDLCTCARVLIMPHDTLFILGKNNHTTMGCPIMLCEPYIITCVQRVKLDLDLWV